jgi:hypothetical protein
MYNGGSTKAGLSAYKNPTQVNQLEGQAFYACMAPMQYTLQTTSTNAATQKIRADKQKICAETITKMLKIDSTASASTPTKTDGCVNRNLAPAALVATGTQTEPVGGPGFLRLHGTHAVHVADNLHKRGHAENPRRQAEDLR